MKRFTKTMAALGLAAVMGTGSAFISLADVTTSVNPVATSRKSGWVDVQNHWYYFDANGNPVKTSGFRTETTATGCRKTGKCQSRNGSIPKASGTG